MAIEEFGKSLLADVRKRKDDQARDARRREERNALKELAITGVVSIGNSMLKDKANSFLESEDFYRQNMQFKKGHGIANEYINNEKLARNDKLGYDAYWSNVAEADRVDALMTEQYGEKKNHSIADWSDLRATTIKALGASARKNHEDGLETAKSFIYKAGDKGAEFYADFAKQSRPTTIAELITNKAKTMLGGKDLNIVAREEARLKYLGDAQTLIAYDKAWDATGDNQSSAFLADTTKTLGAADPIVSQEYKDLGGFDTFNRAKGQQIVTKSTDSKGNVTIVLPQENLGMGGEEYEVYKGFNTFVTDNSTNSIAAQAVQKAGLAAYNNARTDEDTKFFEDIAKEAGAKVSGTDLTKVIDNQNRIMQANIAGLKIVFSRQYGMNEDVSDRLAVSVYRKQLEDTKARRETGELGVNPFNNAKTFGTMIAMAQEQAITSSPRDFSNASIEEITDSNLGKVAMFEDYRMLRPQSMKKYDNLVLELGNSFVTETHERMKGIVAIAIEYPKISDLGTLEKLYYDSLEKPEKDIQVINDSLINPATDKPVVPELVPLSKLVKPDAVSTSQGSSYLNPMSGKRYAKKAPTQLEAYNKLLALETVAQKKKARSDESIAALKPEFKNRIGTPQKSSMKAIAELEKAYKAYITKYGEV